MAERSITIFELHFCIALPVFSLFLCVKMRVILMFLVSHRAYCTDATSLTEVSTEINDPSIACSPEEIMQASAGQEGGRHDSQPEPFSVTEKELKLLREKQLGSEAESLPPYLGGSESPSRYDTFGSKTLELLERVAVTVSSKVFVAREVEGQFNSPVSVEEVVAVSSPLTDKYITDPRVLNFADISGNKRKRYSDQDPLSPAAKTPRLGPTFASPEATTRHRVVAKNETPAKNREPGRGTPNDGIKRVIVKYTNNCMESSPYDEHPLIKEYIITKYLGGYNLAPKAHFLSPAGVLTGEIPFEQLASRIKSKSIESVAGYSKCVNSNRQVRYIVQELVGPTWSNYFAYLSKLFSENKGAEAGLKTILSDLKIAISALRLVQKVHEWGIMHNDIHAGNIAFLDPSLEFSHIYKNPSSFEMVLIDFGMAKVFFDWKDSWSSSHGLNPVLLSPWQLEASCTRSGPRDDVIRIIDSIAQHLNPVLTKYLNVAFRNIVANKYEGMADFRKVLFNFKKTGPMFGPSNFASVGCCTQWNLDPKIVSHIQTSLDTIRSNFITSAESSATAVVDYGSIIDGLQELITYLEPTPSAKV